MKRVGAMGLLLVLSGGAQAADCTLSLTDINFGAISQLNPDPVDVQGSLTVQCQAEAGDLEGLPLTATVDYSISMNGGGSGSAVARAMSGLGLGASLGYNIYVDAGRQMVWGDGNNGTQVVGGQFVFTELEVLAGTQKSADHISYARIPPGINVPPDTYTDTVTVTLTF
ncbi:MAG TPA: spore coat U domain-containing protein [Nevskiales bacterium]|nr:spore coat U domain-containing protein [Nevskiales bacterium]